MNIRKDFVFLKKHIYLDAAAGSLKPKSVIEAMDDYYSFYPINPHSAESKAGVIVMNKIEETRELIAKLINCKKDEIIFTSGSTDSLNKISLMLKDKLHAGDEIIISPYNHSSNHIPWLEIAHEKNAKIIVSEDIAKAINPKTKIIAFAEVNNTIDHELDLDEIAKKAKKVGAIIVNDIAQAIAHHPIDFKLSDVVVFSGNKLYGPTGIGALVVKSSLLKTLKPVTFGGGATAKADAKNWTGKPGINLFEAGTPNIAGIIGLGEAIKYFNKLMDNNLFIYEKEIAEYAYDQIKTLENVKIYSKRGDTIIMFNIDGINPQDITSYLGHKGIIIRSGSHCAKMLERIIDSPFSLRVSLAGYNNKKDIDALVKAIKNGGDFLDFI